MKKQQTLLVPLVENINTASSVSVDERPTLSWAQGFSIASPKELDELEQASCMSFASLVFPTGSAEQQRLIADYFAWLILFDDAVAETRSQQGLDRLLSFIGPNSEVGLAPYRAALNNLCMRAPLRFATSVSGYINGCIMESVFRLTTTVPTVAQYDVFRPYTIGMEPILDIVLSSVPPISTTIRRRCSRLCAWANDLLSYDRERDTDDNMNLVTVLSKSHGLIVGSLYELESTALERDIEQLEPKTVSLLADCINGNMAWYATSPRYKKFQKTA